MSEAPGVQIGGLLVLKASGLLFLALAATAVGVWRLYFIVPWEPTWRSARGIACAVALILAGQGFAFLAVVFFFPALFGSA